MNIDKIKEIKKFSETHDAEDTKKYIMELFQGTSYDIQREDISQAFYEIHTTNIFPKDANGLHISIIEGDGDRSQGLHARSGMDILISNPLKDESFYLFEDGERVKDAAVDLSDQTITKKDITDYLKLSHDVNTIIYKYLDEELKNDQAIIESFTKKIEADAKFRTIDEERYSDISPNGGMDVYVHPWQDHYLEKLNEFREGNCDKLIDYAEKQFCSDKNNQKYIKDELLRNKKIIYYVDNKEKYMEMQKHEFNDYYASDEIYGYDQQIKDLEQKIKETNDKIKNSSQVLEKMQNGFISRFIYRNKIKSLKDSISAMEEDISGYKEQINYANENINDIREDLAQEKDKLEPVKYEFQYPLKDHYIETYDYSEPVRSFERMIDRIETKYPEAMKSIESFNRLLALSKVDKSFDHSHDYKILNGKDTMNLNDHVDKIRKNVQESFSKSVFEMDDIKAENTEQEIDAADYIEESFGRIRI